MVLTTWSHDYTPVTDLLIVDKATNFSVTLHLEVKSLMETLSCAVPTKFVFCPVTKTSTEWLLKN